MHPNNRRKKTVKDESQVSPTMSSNSQTKKTPSTWSTRHILIVDDTDVCLLTLNHYINKYLQEMGLSARYKVVKATSGVQSLKLARSLRDSLCVVFMDIRMPGELDGIEATKKIRNFDQKLKIYAHTTCCRKADQRKYYEAGMNGTIPKPVDKSLLHSVLRRVVKNGTK